MKVFIRLILAMVVLAGSLWAAEKGALFTNLTSDSNHRATMAVQFSAKMMAKGHPLTIYLNDRGVVLASKANKEFALLQGELSAAIKNGATVYICPMCMKEYKVEGKDLLEGVKLGNADLLEAALFAPNTSTINW